MAELKIKITGIDRLRKKLPLSPADLDALFKGPMEDFGREVKEAAQGQAPVLTGNLRSTASVVGRRKTRFTRRLAIKFGGGPGEGQALPRPDVLGPARVDYAVAVHERHPRKSKFLEQPFFQLAPTFYRGIAEGILKLYKRRRVRISG